MLHCGNLPTAPGPASTPTRTPPPACHSARPRSYPHCDPSCFAFHTLAQPPRSPLSRPTLTHAPARACAHTRATPGHLACPCPRRAPRHRLVLTHQPRLALPFPPRLRSRHHRRRACSYTRPALAPTPAHPPQAHNASTHLAPPMPTASAYPSRPPHPRLRPPLRLCPRACPHPPRTHSALPTPPPTPITFAYPSRPPPPRHTC